MGPKKSIKTPAQGKEIKKAAPGLRPCALCDQGRLSGKNELETAGRFYKLENSYYHYFCLLFSVNGKQRGEDDQGVHGFLHSDIKTILKENASHKCRYCQKSKASAKYLPSLVLRTSIVSHDRHHSQKPDVDS